MRRIGYAGTCRAYLSTVRYLIGSHALGAPVRIDSVCGADGLVGALWPTVSTQPGNCGAFFSDDFVGYLFSFLSGLVFAIVTFPLRNVNQEAKRPFTNGGVQIGPSFRKEGIKGVDNIIERRDSS